MPSCVGVHRTPEVLRPQKSVSFKPRGRPPACAPTSLKRRQSLRSAGFAKEQPIDLTEEASGDDDDTSLACSSATKRGRVALSPSPKKKSLGSSSSPKGEKRARRFRAHPPQSWLERKRRALTQRMFVIDRKRRESTETPAEVVELAGSTGNVYRVVISEMHSCTCPDYLKGHECKHIIYVLNRTLKAPEHLQYQVALLPSELQEILDNAPPHATASAAADADSNNPSNRKPVEGDCPICYTDFGQKKEEIVYCKAACGNNVHKTCFEQWKRSQAGRTVTCIMCRTPWQGDDDPVGLAKDLKAHSRFNGEGYVNVGSALGLSSQRAHTINPGLGDNAIAFEAQCS